ncbi:hypothetical protein GCM10009527_082310 [Actinomadura nitritigenes]|uniref:Lipoprotein n=1 Tax=Actinomadura nitritigenes TaxID=134602 RepID=A0ABS3QSA7_9ACTN|nr:hypothetical protein [Actinomadura nitritigenes]MBO2436637.1 hypothetical protein [Actinomadura nitritigenes]
MRLSHRLAATAAAALLLAGAMAGCSTSDGGSGGGSGGSGGSGRAAQGSLGKAFVDRFDKPVAKATFDSPMAPGAKVDIAVMGLRVKGRLATLTLQWTPHVTGSSNNPTPYRLNGEHGLDASLIDSVNLKRYVVVSDSGYRNLESDVVLTNLPNDQATLTTHTFAAPPANVKSIDVQLGSWPAFRDVPVER